MSTDAITPALLSATLEPLTVAFLAASPRLSQEDRKTAAKAPDAFLEEGPALMARIHREADALDAAAIDTEAVLADLEEVAEIDRAVELLEDLRRGLLDLRLQRVERAWRATLVYRHIAEGRATTSPRHEVLLRDIRALFAPIRKVSAAAK